MASGGINYVPSDGAVVGVDMAIISGAFSNYVLEVSTLFSKRRKVLFSV